jgi:hypothetical protein
MGRTGQCQPTLNPFLLVNIPKSTFNVMIQMLIRVRTDFWQLLGVF